MSKASKLIENEQFADRLRLALKGVGIRPSATVLANEFNLRYWGESITITFSNQEASSIEESHPGEGLMKFQLIRKYHLTRPLMAAARLAAARLKGSHHGLTL